MINFSPQNCIYIVDKLMAKYASKSEIKLKNYIRYTLSNIIVFTNILTSDFVTIFLTGIMKDILLGHHFVID